MVPSKNQRTLLILVAILLLAAALRIIGLDRSPLRGDEAFAVRYWAASPASILDPTTGLAWREPHPFGTFFTFWAWKSIFGDSEIMMRLLPALFNLLGAAAIFTLGKWLFHERWVGLAAAFLWAVNPGLIWHSQDVRNYAIWAALSVLAFAFLERAARRKSRIAWAAYVVAALLAFYMFFFEGFFLALHGVYILIMRRERLRTWLFAALVIAVLSVPVLVQAGVLVNSGYRGTALDIQAVNWDSIPSFYFTLAYGTTLAPNSMVTFLFILYLVVLFQLNRERGFFLALYFLVPLLILALISMRIAIFDARYILACVPAIILPWAYVIGRVARGLTDARVMENLDKLPNIVRQGVIAMVIILPGAFVVPIGMSLLNYYSPDYRKAPDWYTLRDYLRANATDQDTVVVGAYDDFGTTDPAFAYYYPGPANVIPLPYPGLDTRITVRRELDSKRAVWFVVGGVNAAQVNGALLDQGALISDDFPVRQYRAKAVKPSEVDTPLDLSVGGGTLRGYSLTGLRRAGNALTLLIYWDTLPDANFKMFVHLMGNGTQPVTQDDHPITGVRDVYRLDLKNVPPGDYQILIGLYDPSGGARQPIRSTSKGDQGTVYTLVSLRLTGN